LLLPLSTVKQNNNIIFYECNVKIHKTGKSYIVVFSTRGSNSQLHYLAIDIIYITYTLGHIYSSSFVLQADLNLVYTILLPSQILKHTIKLSSDETNV